MMDAGWDRRQAFFLSLGLVVSWLVASYGSMDTNHVTREFGGEMHHCSFTKLLAGEKRFG